MSRDILIKGTDTHWNEGKFDDYIGLRIYSHPGTKGKDSVEMQIRTPVGFSHISLSRSDIWQIISVLIDKIQNMR